MLPVQETFWAHWRKNVQLWVFAGVILAVLAGVGIVFFVRGQRLMEMQLRENLRMVAAVSTHQFDGDVLKSLHGKDAIESPMFPAVVRGLRAIRRDMPAIRFAYLMRRTDDANVLEFIADADSLATPAELDRNGNGTVEEDEEASYPGDSYDASDAPALSVDAFEGPSVDPEITYDQWGALISGYAPIRDGSGSVVAVLGIDMVADDFVALSQQLFSPIAFLLFLLGSLGFTAYIIFFVWRRRIDSLRRIDEERKGIMLLASHQLGTPLTIFKWSLESLMDSKARQCLGEEAFSEYVANVTEGIARLEGILRELRRATDVEEGKLPYRPEDVRLSELIIKVGQTAKPYLEQSNHTLRLDLDDNVRLHVDPQLMSAVIRELLDNAATFSKPRSTIVITTRATNESAEIDVSDTGCGIPAKDLPQIFNKFYRAANAYVWKPDGAGLGLFIARGIVEMAGGTIRIESKEAKGTTVTVTLPLTEAVIGSR